MRIERSEIAENDAFEVTGTDVARSGGLHLYNDAVDLQGPGDRMAVKIVNSTISGNTSSATAGAMVAFANVALELDNTTVADNLAPPTRTGGIVMSFGDTYPISGSNTARPTLTVVSSILANNSSDGGDVAVNAFLVPYTINATSSLIEKLCFGGTCGTIAVQGAGNLTSVGAIPGPDPMLGLLAYNGGTTRTHALLPGSPAINAGSNPLGLPTDQRGSGFLRSIGATDMGAYESGQAIPFTNFAYESKFGTAGTGNGQFNVPVGVAIDPTSQKIVVVDSANHRVQIFDSSGANPSQFGSVGSGNGQFSSPYMAAIDPTTHNIAVTDLGNNRVQIFSSSGAYITKFDSFGSAAGPLNQPVGVAIDPLTHNIYVVDHGNNRVQIFSSSGTYLSQFGSPGSGDGQFNAPDGIAIDATTHVVFVADTVNNRVQAFDLAGNYLAQGGTQGSGNKQFNLPSGIAVDPVSHNIIVADNGNNRVQIFNSAGEYLSQFGSSGSADGLFSGPYGIAIDPMSHKIVVVDENNNRVQIFAPQ